MAIRRSFSIRLSEALCLFTLAAACASPPVTKTDAPSSVVEPGSLTGRWHGASEGLTVDLTLAQAGDSVTGSGTYSVPQSSSVGCGGESLSGTGPVTLRGSVTGKELSGRMTFSGSWSPPYLGTVSTSDSLNGHFMSIDRGGCPLALVRQH